MASLCADGASSNFSLCCAGEEGVTRSSVGHSLGLTAKKANRNLSAFATKFGIREAFAQHGKAQIKVRTIWPLLVLKHPEHHNLVSAHQAYSAEHSPVQAHSIPSSSGTAFHWHVEKLA